jgi:RHS repeat-associated protein
MKLNHAMTLSLALILSPLLRAADMPAPMPEFMNQQQLAKWKVEQAAEAKADAAAASEAPTQFYTGKPYDADAGGYIFKYRTYNPEMARWTTADPSGFPDGANNLSYVAEPSSQLDPTGLTSFSVGSVTGDISGVPNSSETSGRLSITVVQAATANGDVSGTSQVSFAVNGLTGSSSTTYGWVVQEIQITYGAAYANGTVYKDSQLGTSGYPTTYWEAWQVEGNGAVNATSNGVVFAPSLDTFQSPTFPDSTHGYYNVTGSITVFSNAAVGSTGPSTWGTLTIAGAIPATATEPTWFGGNSTYAHDLQMSWE